MRFQVLTAVSMNMTVFWDVAPCSLVEIDRRFRGAYCLYHQGRVEAVSTSETSVNLYKATRRNILERRLLKVFHFCSVVNDAHESS
jgi:hypothetical protein